MNVSFAPLRPDAAAYLTEKTGIDYRPQAPFAAPRWFCVTARDDEGHVAGVILAEFISHFEAHFNSAVENPRCATRRLLRATYTALFSRAVRLTALIEPTNTRAIRNAVRMGFVHEGFIRRGMDGRRDAYLFGMLKDDCKFLPGHTGGLTVTMEPSYGIDTKTA